MRLSPCTASVLATVVFSLSGAGIGMGLATAKHERTQLASIVTPATTPAVAAPTTTEAPLTTTTAAVPETVAPTTTPPTEVPAQVATGAATLSKGNSWTTVSSDACHCSAEFPSKPVSQSLSVPDASDIQLLSASGSNGLNVGVLSQHVDNLSGDDATLRTIADAVADKAGVSLENVSFAGGKYGRQLSAKSSDGSRLQAFTANSTLYVLVVGSNDGDELDAAFSRVTNSFTAR